MRSMRVLCTFFIALNGACGTSEPAAAPAAIDAGVADAEGGTEPNADHWRCERLPEGGCVYNFQYPRTATIPFVQGNAVALGAGNGRVFVLTNVDTVVELSRVGEPPKLLGTLGDQGSRVFKSTIVTPTDLLVMNMAVGAGPLVFAFSLSANAGRSMGDVPRQSSEGVMRSNGTLVTYTAGQGANSFGLVVAEIATGKKLLGTFVDGAAATTIGGTVYVGGSKLQSYSLSTGAPGPVVDPEPVGALSDDGATVFYVRGKDTMRFAPGGSPLRVGPGLPSIDFIDEQFLYGTKLEEGGSPEGGRKVAVVRLRKTGGELESVVVIRTDALSNVPAFGNGNVYAILQQRLYEHPLSR